MAYSDNLIEASFKVDPHGRIIFYPWAVFSFPLLAVGNGYVLPDERSYYQLRRTLKDWTMVQFIAIIAIFMIPGWSFKLVPLTLPAIWYYLRIYRHVRDFPVAKVPLTRNESYHKFAQASSRTFLWSGTLIGLLLCVAGVLTLFTMNIWLSSLLVVVLGAGWSVFYSYLLTLKHS